MDLLTMADVAEYCGVTKNTVKKWRDRERLPEPDHMAGNRPLWEQETIADWAHNTGRKSRQDAAGERLERMAVEPIPYRYEQGQE